MRLHCQMFLFQQSKIIKFFGKYGGFGPEICGYVVVSWSPTTRTFSKPCGFVNLQVTKCPRKAALVVGGVKPTNNCVSEQWVLGESERKT